MRNGEPLMIKCHASGFPTPSIKWKRLGKTIGDQALYFNSLKRSDGGVYLCEAYNQAGKDSKEIIVRVNDSPNSSFQQRRKVNFIFSSTTVSKSDEGVVFQDFILAEIFRGVIL